MNLRKIYEVLPKKQVTCLLPLKKNFGYLEDLIYIIAQGCPEITRLRIINTRRHILVVQIIRNIHITCRINLRFLEKKDIDCISVDVVRIGQYEDEYELLASDHCISLESYHGFVSKYYVI